MATKATTKTPVKKTTKVTAKKVEPKKSTTTKKAAPKKTTTAKKPTKAKATTTPKIGTGKDLIVVESPNKVKSISKIVGNKYNVMASAGHIMRIADKGYKNLGIDVQDGTFKISYSKIADKSDIIRNLKLSVQEAKTVYLATDLDREGELISANLKEALKLKKDQYKRITFNEITEKAILEALENPRDIDQNMVDAAETRSIEDKVIGYLLSQIARKNVGANSVGRVQSSALIIICEREEEIIGFESKKYFEIYIQILKDKKTYLAKYIGTVDGENKDLSSEELVQTIIERCNLNGKYNVKEVNKNARKVSPPKPLITTSMQTEASSKLGLSPNETMRIAQQLFEGPDAPGIDHGLITYIRTDKAEYSEDFGKAAENYIIHHFGREYLAKTKVKAATKKVKEGEAEVKAQEAHEGIHPVDLSITPEMLQGHVNNNVYRLYKMIYERSIASYMPPKELEITHIIINNLNDLFRYSYTDVVFDGFSKIYEDGKDDDDTEEDVNEKLDLKVGDKADVKDIYSVEKETKPPRRFSEAGLIKQLESSGIGRPSTYASTMKTLKDREYIEIQRRIIQPTDLGMRLYKFLKEHFNDTINVAYTSKMEKDLDEILEGNVKKLDVLTKFYEEITNNITTFNANYKREVQPEELVGKKCPLCGEELLYKIGVRNQTRYIGCSNFPACKHVEWIPKPVDESVPCPECDNGFIVPKTYYDKKTKAKKTFYACSGYPSCKHIMEEKTYKELLEKSKSE